MSLIRPCRSLALFVFAALSLLFVFSHHVSAASVVPTNLTASIVQHRIINLTWNMPDGASATGYVLYLNGNALATTTAPNYSYTSITLPGARACFSILSYDANGLYSAQTDPTCVVVPVGTTMAPSEIKATVGSSNTVDLSWTYLHTVEEIRTLDPGEEGYRFLFLVERSVDGGVTWSHIITTSFEYDAGQFGDAGGPQIKTTDQNAPTGSMLSYRVTAFDESGGEQGKGFSVPSVPVTAETPHASAGPNAPTELAVFFPQPTQGYYTFKDNSNDETGWVIERRIGDVWSDFATYAYPNNFSSFTFTNGPRLNLDTAYTLRARAVNSYGRSEPSNTIEFVTPPTYAWSEPIASKHILIVYNADDPRSVEIKNYYLAHRPLVSDANTIGVHFQAPGLDNNGFDVTSLDTSVFKPNVLTPITNWLIDHPDKPIRYIIMMWGMPTLESGYATGYGMNPVGYQISTALQTRGVRAGSEYRAGKSITTHFTPEYWKGTTALVTYMDMGTVEATKAYIDKLAFAYQQMPRKQIIISARDAGTSGDTYYIDNDSGEQRAIIAENPTAKVVVKPGSGHFNQASDVRGFSTGGTHAGFNQHFAVNGDLTFSGNSNWYIFRTFESWNGNRNTVTSHQSSFTEWFSANAFGGSNYSHTPVGAIAHVLEPSVDANTDPAFFTLWERGYPFAEAAWASRNTWAFLAIGDPLVSNAATPGIISSSPTCTSFVYSAWSTCTNGTQTRTITSRLPSDCTGGTPLLTQSCSTASVFGDFNQDGSVNSVDFSAMIRYWDQNNAAYDLNSDGNVNTLDYSIMAQHWTG